MICDATAPDHPVVFVNAAFVAAVRLSGGGTARARTCASCRAPTVTRRARAPARGAAEGRPARVLVRNYRPDGSLFWNESVVQPVRSGRRAHPLHRLSPRCERAAEERRAREPGGPALVAARGPPHGAAFARLLRGTAAAGLALAQRDSHEIGLTLFDIDDLGAYNDKFDRAAGDACIRRVARVIGASYRRGGDLVGRWEGGTFAVLTQGDAAERATDYARIVAQRVRDLLMHHPTAGGGRYVTVSAGVASLVPPRDCRSRDSSRLLQSAMKRAKGTARTPSRPPRRRTFEQTGLPALRNRVLPPEAPQAD